MNPEIQRLLELQRYLRLKSFLRRFMRVSPCFLGFFLPSSPPNFLRKLNENIIIKRLEYEPESSNFKFIPG